MEDIICYLTCCYLLLYVQLSRPRRSKCPLKMTPKKKTMYTMPLHIVLLALLLLSIPQALSEPILSFPPRSPPFQMEFAFEDSQGTVKEHTINVSDGMDVQTAAKELVARVYGRNDLLELEQLVVDRILIQSDVYNVENHRNYDLVAGKVETQTTPQIIQLIQTPLFSLNVLTSNHTNNIIHFFHNDSVQFALRRFNHQNNIYNNDLSTREHVLVSLHQKKIVYMRHLCNQNKTCLIEQCRRFAPQFPGYEHGEPIINHKNSILLSTAYRSRVTNCVETGTYEGSTTLLLAKEICEERVISIELSKKFAQDAKNRFAAEVSKGNTYANKITLLQGDSGDVLHNNPMFDALKKTTLWFLDGHYSFLETARGVEDSPLIRELNYILNRNKKDRKDIVLVDDVREFRGNRFPRSVQNVDVMDLAYPELDDIIKDTICTSAPEAFVDLIDDVLIIKSNFGTVVV